MERSDLQGTPARSSGWLEEARVGTRWFEGHSLPLGYILEGENDGWADESGTSQGGFQCNEVRLGRGSIAGQKEAACCETQTVDCVPLLSARSRSDQIARSHGEKDADDAGCGERRGAKGNGRGGGKVSPGFERGRAEKCPAEEQSDKSAQEACFDRDAAPHAAGLQRLAYTESALARSCPQDPTSTQGPRGVDFEHLHQHVPETNCGTSKAVTAQARDLGVGDARLGVQLLV